MMGADRNFLRMLQIMVVEDDATFRAFLQAQLELLGCQIVPVESGDAAWERIQAQPPDLLLTDVFMPGMSGLELCRRVKSSPALADLPVVLLTMAGPRSKDEGYAAGADDFLNKPPHLVELRTRLQNLLQLRSLRSVPGPVEAAPAPPVPAPFAPEPPAGPPPERGGPRSARILLLESYGILREHVRAILGNEGWEVHAVATTEDFLNRLEALRPDLVIIDHDLLEGPGSALAARLRSHATTSDLPVLLMCDPQDLGPAGSAWAAGANEHLAKPFESAELRARVRTLLRQVRQHLSQDARHPDSDPAALKDPVSGAYTRPFLYASLDALCGFALKTQSPVSLLGCRLPRPREAGNARIREIAGRIRAELQGHELLCRMDDGLFVAVLPGVSSLVLAQRMAGLSGLRAATSLAGVTSSVDAPSLLLKRLMDQLDRLGLP